MAIRTSGIYVARRGNSGVYKTMTDAIDVLFDYARVTLYGVIALLFYMHSTSVKHRASDWIMTILMSFIGINLLLRNAGQPIAANFLADYGITAVLILLAISLVRGSLRKH